MLPFEFLFSPLASHLLDAVVDQQLGNVPAQSRVGCLHKHQHLGINA